MPPDALRCQLRVALSAEVAVHLWWIVSPPGAVKHLEQPR